MAIAKRAYANNADVGNDTPLAVSVGSITTGDGIVVAFGTGGGTHTSVTDNLGNSYTKVRSEWTDAGGSVWSWWECRNANGGTLTVTLTPSGNSGIVGHVWVGSGMRTASQMFDAGNNAEGTSSTATGGTITPSADGAVILALAACQTQAVTAGANGYTLEGVDAIGIGLVRLIQTTASSTHADATLAGSGTWAVTTAVFLAPAEFAIASLYRWNGSAWVAPGVLKRWSGSAWVPHTLKIYEP